MYWFGLVCFLWCGGTLGWKLWSEAHPRARKVKPQRVNFQPSTPRVIRPNSDPVSKVNPPPLLSYLTEVDKLWLSRHLQLAGRQP